MVKSRLTTPGHGWRGIVCILLMLLVPCSAQVAAAELLPQQQAYRLAEPQLVEDMLTLSWQIADGYYLYRDKFRFESQTAGVELGTALLPGGQFKQDEFFGRMEIYRGRLQITIPVVVSDTALKEFVLRVSSQGCADVGVCYAPYTEDFTVTLAAAASPAVPAGQGLLSTIGRKLGLLDEQQRFLDPDEAFIPSVDVQDALTLQAHWDIADGYYLYRDKFVFDITQPDGLAIRDVRSPGGKFKEDEYFGRMEIYYKNVDILLALQRQQESVAQPVLMAVTYQGCADGGFCYPPITKTMEIVLPPAGAVNAPANDGIMHDTLPEQDRIARLLAGDEAWLTALGLFGVGLLLAFTPCVFPMVPILSSIIVGQGQRATTRRAFTLSLTYVLAMALTYTIAGVLAGLFGQNLQILFQNPWVIGSFSLIFVLLALSMFGFYELQMPSGWQSRLDAMSARQQGGGYLGVAIMGLLSALIVGPCVAAPLAGVLVYIGLSGDAMLGGFSLFMMSLGMGAPLLLIGTSAGQLLPRVGPWMTTIKAVFGVMLLALAIWMLDRILPRPAIMLLSAALLIGSAVFMGAFSRLETEATGWQKLWKGSGLLLAIYAALLLIGAASGGDDLLQPLKAWGQTGPQQASLNFKQIKGGQGLQQALRQARGQPVMLDFYADWCVDCKIMERQTFSNAAVRQALGDTVLLRADVTLNDVADQALLKQFNLFGPPAILFFDRKGREMPRYRLIGLQGADEFRDHIRRMLATADKS